MIKAKIMIIGMNNETASEYSDRASLRSRSCWVFALCFTRIIPAGIISAISKMFRVQKPAAARTDAATIATSTSRIFFMIWNTLNSILKNVKYRIDFNCQVRLKGKASRELKAERTRQYVSISI